MDIINEFYKKVEEKNICWTVKGLIDEKNMVYSLGSDSKLIGRIFEIVISNILQEIADENDYIMEPVDSQTVYPDFTFINKKDKRKIAVDIKTTYRNYYTKNKEKKEIKEFQFCLGSYGSYLRNNTKNIKYPYDEYDSHYMICFLYDRNNDSAQAQYENVSSVYKIKPPYNNVQVIIQEKYKIVGDKPGSGNTENIGSFKTNDLDKLKNGQGPFAFLGEDIYVDYWRHYPRYREKNVKYNNLDGYFKWKLNNTKDDEVIKEINEEKLIYEKWKNNNKKKEL